MSLAVVLAAFMWANAAWGAPITFNTALPVARGNFVLREQLLLTRLGDDPSGANREVEVLGAVSALGYGVTRNFALFGVLPYLDKTLRLDMGGQRITRDTAGLGDLVLFGRYTVFEDNAPGRTLRAAPFLGVKTPTGKHDEGDAFGRLPPTLQLGTGSTDPFAGIVATYQTLDFQIDAQASFRDNRESGGVEFGDVARVDASLQYRLLPRDFSGGGVPSFLYGVLETNWMRQDKTSIDGNEDPDTGGTTLFLAPGLQYVTRKWIFEGAVQVPVVQNLNGNALESEFTLRAGFRVNI